MEVAEPPAAAEVVELPADYTVVDPQPPFGEWRRPETPASAPVAPLGGQPTAGGRAPHRSTWGGRAEQAEPGGRETSRTAVPLGRDEETPTPSSASPVPTAPVTSTLRPVLTGTLFVLLMALATALGVLYARYGNDLWRKIQG